MVEYFFLIQSNITGNNLSNYSLSIQDSPFNYISIC